MRFVGPFQTGGRRQQEPDPAVCVRPCVLRFCGLRVFGIVLQPDLRASARYRFRLRVRRGAGLARNRRQAAFLPGTKVFMCFVKSVSLAFAPSEKESNICGISTTTYKTLYALYTELTISEREIVDSTSDKAGIEIKQSMKVLKDTFQQTPSPSNSGTTWNQKGAISFIIIVAVIGMTSICVFYLMKTKQIID